MPNGDSSKSGRIKLNKNQSNKIRQQKKEQKENGSRNEIEESEFQTQNQDEKTQNFNTDNEGAPNNSPMELNNQQDSQLSSENGDSSDSQSTDSNNNAGTTNEPSYVSNEIPPRVLATVAIISGVLIMVGGFIAYRYFSDAGLEDEPEFQTNIAEVQIENGETTEEDSGQITSGASTSRAEEEWAEPGDTFGIVPPESINSEVGTVSGDPSDLADSSGVVRQPEEPTIRSADSASGTTSTAGWTANDYQFGDINAGSYTVEEGDTLWEIAEAVYGSGGDWNKILDANSDDISFLSNGNPLIVPGQVLEIPPA